MQIWTQVDANRAQGPCTNKNIAYLICQLFPQHHQRYRMSFLLPPPPGFRPPPGMAPTREASGSRMPPEGISYFHHVRKFELSSIIYSYHPQIAKMGSNAKKKIR